MQIRGTVVVTDADWLVLSATRVVGCAAGCVWAVIAERVYDTQVLANGLMHMPLRNFRILFQFLEYTMPVRNILVVGHRRETHVKP